MDETGLGSSLNAVARLVLHVLGQKLIDTQWHLPFVHLYAEMLIELAIGRRLLTVWCFQLVQRLQVVQSVQYLVVSHAHDDGSLLSNLLPLASYLSPLLYRIHLFKLVGLASTIYSSVRNVEHHVAFFFLLF